MKKTILVSALLLCGFLFQSAIAQPRLNVNIGSQPTWGPVGYDHVNNYYLPDIDTYYSVPNRKYTYLQNGKWKTSSSLPQMYRSYDLYKGYKVVVNEPNPYKNAKVHRAKYGSYKNNHSQEVIRNSRDSKYFVNKGHPEYNNWKNKNRTTPGNNSNPGNNGNKGTNKKKQ